jgi:predicted transcriptional regulator
MLTIEELRIKLKNMNLAAVSRDSGVSYPTIYKIFTGSKSVSYKSVKALSDNMDGLK